MTQKIFNYLPVPFWCYFLPALLSTAGLIPSQNPFYGKFSVLILPACLFLLLIGTDLPAILHLGPKALAAMAVGTVGIAIGGILTYFIGFHRIGLEESWGDQVWKGWGALSATWTGGSANMLSVKEILGVPEALFSNLVITDTVVAYTWMAFLVFLSSRQRQYDLKFTGSQGEEFQSQTVDTVVPNGTGPLSEKLAVHLSKTILLIFISLVIGWICSGVSSFLPVFGAFFNSFTWIILLATLIPLTFSFTPARRLEEWGASRVGIFMLYLILTTMGARADLHSLTAAPLFISLGLVWVMVHGLVLFLLGRIFKIPLRLLATASQANVGGTVSAPLVASIYSKDLAPVGLLLAVAGNIYGTYLGLFLGKICRTISILLK
ncbi:MAG: DUF819 family protein [Elusimicrobia bacterium]|nr:DUF819 family protein [Elusimicrobiota bacterium]